MEIFELINTADLEDELEKPSIEPVCALEESAGDYARVSLGPLPGGWGVTIGNPLRRSLYRELSGYALAGVVFDDFDLDDAGRLAGTLSSPENIVLSLRGVRVAYLGDGNERPRALCARIESADGARELLLSNVSVPAGFAVVGGPERLGTLSGERAVGADLSYLLGRGYVMAPEGSNPDAGRFLTDRAFSPVIKADYRVERMRVGSITNFERLIVSVWTNGTMNAAEAIVEVAENLGKWYARLSDWAMRNGASDDVPDALVLDTEAMVKSRHPIERLNIGGRAVNILKRVGAESIMDVLVLSRDDLLMLKGFGDRTYWDLVEALRAGGYTEGLDAASHWMSDDMKADDP